MPAKKELPPFDHHRDGSEKRPAVAADRLGFSTHHHGQQQRLDGIGSEPIASGGGGSGSEGLLLPVRRSGTEAVVVVPPRLFVATAAGEGTRPEGSTGLLSARSTPNRRSPERYAARASKRSLLRTDSLQRQPPPPPPPQPPAANGQQQEAPLGGNHSERRVWVESLLPESSSVDSFESWDGLLFPDSYAGSRSLDLRPGDGGGGGGGGGGSGGGRNGVGVLGFSDTDEFPEAELAPAAAREEGEADLTPLRDNSTDSELAFPLNA
ncbi:unnamed protein product [Ectocarpus fasciculatus]